MSQYNMRTSVDHYLVDADKTIKGVEDFLGESIQTKGGKGTVASTSFSQIEPSIRTKKSYVSSNETQSASFSTTDDHKIEMPSLKSYSNEQIISEPITEVTIKSFLRTIPVKRRTSTDMKKQLLKKEGLFPTQFHDPLIRNKDLKCDKHMLVSGFGMKTLSCLQRALQLEESQRKLLEEAVAAQEEEGTPFETIYNNAVSFGEYSSENSIQDEKELMAKDLISSLQDLVQQKLEKHKAKMQTIKEYVSRVGVEGEWFSETSVSQKEAFSETTTQLSGAGDWFPSELFPSSPKQKAAVYFRSQRIFEFFQLLITHLVSSQPEKLFVLTMSNSQRGFIPSKPFRRRVEYKQKTVEEMRTKMLKTEPLFTPMNRLTKEHTELDLETVLTKGFGIRNLASLQRALREHEEARQRQMELEAEDDNTPYNIFLPEVELKESLLTVEKGEGYNEGELLNIDYDKSQEMDQKIKYLMSIDDQGNEEDMQSYIRKPTVEKQQQIMIVPKVPTVDTSSWDDVTKNSISFIKAKLYLKEHKTFEFFQYLTAHVVSSRADNPIDYLLNLLDRILLYRSGFKAAPPVLYEKKHIGELFKLMDRFGTGFVDMDQYKTAMSTFGICSYNKDPEANEEGLISRETFIKEIYKAEIVIFNDLIRKRTIPDIPLATAEEPNIDTYIFSEPEEEFSPVSYGKMGKLEAEEAPSTPTRESDSHVNKTQKFYLDSKYYSVKEASGEQENE